MSLLIHAAVSGPFFFHSPVEPKISERVEMSVMTTAGAVVKTSRSFHREVPRALSSTNPVESSVRPLEGANSNRAANTYLADLLAYINSAKVYPVLARRLNLQGRVQVAFTIRRDGVINDVHLIESSGHEVLDQAALGFLIKLDHFRPFGAELDRETWPLTLPFSYTLN